MRRTVHGRRGPDGADTLRVPRITRRGMLEVCGVSAAASVLAAAGRTPASEQPRSTPGTARTQSVIFLWMGGGVTHIDSFDPKPAAPEEIRGTLGTLQTALPGIRFGEPMPELARITDELCLLRTFSHDSNDHLLSQVYTLSGRKVTRNQLFSEPNIGSVVSQLQGPRNGLPAYIAVPGITRPGPPPHDLFVGGWLGNQHAPFCVGGRPEQPDFTVGTKQDNPSPLAEEDLNPQELTYPDGLSSGRLARRVSLKSQLESAAGALERSVRQQSLDGQYESALNLLLARGIRRAFDVSEEADATREAYGRTKIGGRCLLARRLVEAGARFVMVDYGYDPDYGNLWDIHNAASQNFPHVSKMCLRGYNLAGMDRAFAALIGDLKDRGLLETTLVVFLTEFGRTPKINANGGRDHWGLCGSLFFAGGGAQRGTVIGHSDAQAAYPETTGYGPADVAATIYAALGIERETRLYDAENRPHPVLDHGAPIPGVLYG